MDLIHSTRVSWGMFMMTSFIHMFLNSCSQDIPPHVLLPCFVTLRCQAVKFGIGSFPTLFGTQDGRDMQAIAKRLHWPLPLGEKTIWGPMWSSILHCPTLYDCFVMVRNQESFCVLEPLALLTPSVSFTCYTNHHTLPSNPQT